MAGPFKQDKLFFFADYEATQQKQFDGSNIFTVPTSAERTGDFSADNFTIYDPLLSDNADGTRQPFPEQCDHQPESQRVAVSRLSFRSAITPSASTCDSDTTGAINNLLRSRSRSHTAQKFDIRLDWTESEKQRIFARFSFDRLFSSLVNAFDNMWDLNYAQNVTNGRNFILG